MTTPTSDDLRDLIQALPPGLRVDTTPDTDGDYAFVRGTARGWVQVLKFDPPLVRVYAEAALDVPVTEPLLRELNDIQLHAVYTAILIHDGRVIVSQTMTLRCLDVAALATAVSHVGAAADAIGVPITAIFGGHTPRPFAGPRARQIE